MKELLTRKKRKWEFCGNCEQATEIVEEKYIYCPIFNNILPYHESICGAFVEVR
jgi:hypothetical protein